MKTKKSNKIITPRDFWELPYGCVFKLTEDSPILYIKSVDDDAYIISGDSNKVAGLRASSEFDNDDLVFPVNYDFEIAIPSLLKCHEVMDDEIVVGDCYLYYDEWWMAITQTDDVDDMIYANKDDHLGINLRTGETQPRVGQNRVTPVEVTLSVED